MSKMEKIIKINLVTEPEERVQIANLLYEGDRPFVPITPLAALSKSTTFYKASFDDQESGAPIRAATSYDNWLIGCDSSLTTKCSVYELASSIVRSPMGGFDKPTLQHIFAFVRMLAIFEPYTEDDATLDEQIAIVTCIAARNETSLKNMTAIGMEELKKRPQWLDYEHRSWFPKGEEERPEHEAHYLWFPEKAARSFMCRLIPYADGTLPIQRKNADDPDVLEEYKIAIETYDFLSLISRYDQDLQKVVDALPFDRLVYPPDKAWLTENRDDALSPKLVF